MTLPLANTFGSVVLEHSGLVLDVNGASTANGATVIQFGFHGGENQRFRFEPTDTSGVFRIVAQHSGKVLEIAGASAQDGAALVQAAPTGTPNQKFTLEEKTGLLRGLFLIRAKHSGKVLGIQGPIVDDAVRVIQVGGPEAGNQYVHLWKFVDKFTGTFHMSLDEIRYLNSSGGGPIDLKGKVTISGSRRVKQGVGYTTKPFTHDLYSTFNGTVFMHGPNDQRPMRLGRGDMLENRGGGLGAITSDVTVTHTLLGMQENFVIKTSAAGPTLQQTIDVTGSNDQSIRLLFTARRELQ